MIKGLVFDLDGVITDSAEYHYQAWKNLGEKIGIKIDREFNEQLKGISRMDSLEKILEYGNKSEDYSTEEKEKLAAEKNDEYLKLIQTTTEKDLLPGIKKLLDDAKEEKLKIALASASKNGPFILERLGIDSYFNEIVNPANLKNGKPNPEIYIKAAEQLGLDTKECIGLEDAQSGIVAVNKAGMFSVGIGDEKVLSEADYRVDNTEDLDLETILEKASLA